MVNLKPTIVGASGQYLGLIQLKKYQQFLNIFNNSLVQVPHLLMYMLYSSHTTWP